MERFKIACAQFPIIPNSIDANTETCIKWIGRASKDHKANLVVLPESATTGFTPNMPLEAFYNIIEPLDGSSVEKVCKAAKDFGIYVIFPMYEKAKKKNIIFNSAIVISDKGEVKGVYRKTHLFPTERINCGGWSTPGKELPVFDCGFAKIGITICYEGDFPELSRILVLKGAEVIARPAAFLRSFEIWELTNKARAYDNHVYVVATNSIGPDAGDNYYFGHSMIVNPLGQKIAQARGTKEIVSAWIESNPHKYVTYGSKMERKFDHIEDRNVSIYDILLLKEAKKRK